MLNKIILIGRLTRDPELRYSSSGTPIAKMGLAVNRRLTKDRERQTDFIDIVAFRQSAEFASNYLTKGRLICVEGQLQIRDWIAQDGTKRRSAEVIADNLQGLDKPKGDGGSGGFSPHEDSTESADMDAHEAPDAYDDPFLEE